VIAGSQERGTPLRVKGRVLQPDGRTPAPGVTVYAYQADASGLYAREGGAEPRLRGFLTTDAEGRFEYRTVRPAPYPGGRVAAHVHHQLWGGGWPAQWSEDLLFADDPLVSPRERERSAQRGRFGGIRQPVRGPDGVLEVEIELRLEPRGDRFEPGTRHGIDACGIAPAP
jgi:protocatechuate 3,4-dioxygenase beta subunit